MGTEPRIDGIHHITAIAADPQPNLDFYTKFLGLRLVKRTVNFDDPGTYHFYFGDHVGTPGTIMTFFPWPGSRRGRAGSGQVTTTSYSVNKGSLDEWEERASRFGIPVTGTATRFGAEVLALNDPDGLMVELVAQGDGTPGTSVEGFAPPTLSVEGYEKTANLLTDMLGFRFVGQEGSRFRFQASGGGLASTTDLLCAPDGPHGLGGAGTVHHIAWRTPDDASQAEWRSRLAAAGFNVTPVMDRQYFHSIYFREPGGILFEIATDNPGFAIDESIETLGQDLKLPSQYEHLRSRIEAVLPVIEV